MPRRKPKKNRESFKLNIKTPSERQWGETALQHERFTKWVEAGFPPFEDIAEPLGISASSVGRYARFAEWERRRDLIIARQEKLLAKANPDDGLLPPPEPIARGLHAFALRYAETIAPGFEIDAVVDVILSELEAWVEGDAGGRLMLNPPPRHSKTTCAILALCYSLLRYPDRGHIIISANGRLSSITSQKFKTLFIAACPEPTD